MPDENPGGFNPFWRDTENNVVQCGTPNTYFSECLKCHNKVIIHCKECTVQVSGCMCTLRKRGEEAARAQSD